MFLNVYFATRTAYIIDVVRVILVRTESQTDNSFRNKDAAADKVWKDDFIVLTLLIAYNLVDLYEMFKCIA